MSIDQSDRVDFATVDNASSYLLLTISDHLPWDEVETHHLFLLQQKLNAYLRFVESGELLKAFPGVVGRPVVINLVCKYSLSENASAFIQNASTVIETAGCGFRVSIHPPN